MTAIPATRKQALGFERNINGDKPKKGDKPKSKSDIMTLHLLTVEKVHGRLSPAELKSEQFKQSRDTFLAWAAQWNKEKIT